MTIGETSSVTISSGSLSPQADILNKIKLNNIGVKYFLKVILLNISILPTARFSDMKITIKSANNVHEIRN
jgi:hypothetical protein